MLESAILYGSLCLLVGILGSYALRRRAARAHVALVVGVVAAAAVGPMHAIVGSLGAGLLASEESVAVAAGIPARGAHPLPAPRAGEGAPSRAQRLVPGRTTEVAVANAGGEGRPVPWSEIAIAAWVVTTSLLLLRVGASYFAGAEVSRQATEIRDRAMTEALSLAADRVGVEREVVLAESAATPSPVIWCFGRTPRLLIPVQRGSIPTNAWEAVFRHELAHLRRHDHRIGVALHLLASLVPWNPLCWWALRRHHDLSERACDDWAASRARHRADYAETLLRFTPTARHVGMPAIRGRRGLSDRVQRLLSRDVDDPAAGARFVALVGAAGLALTGTLSLAQPGDGASNGVESSLHGTVVDAEGGAGRRRGRVSVRRLRVRKALARDVGPRASHDRW